MTKPSTATAFEQDSTLVLALELSGKGWDVGAVLPGVTRRPRRGLAARDMAGLLQQIERWKAEAGRAGRTVRRTVLTYEAGRDGFWIARYLVAHGIEVQIMHPASIPVERRGRRVKTDRIDLDMLLRTLLAWLRGEPRVCSMVRIPSEAEEDMRRPERERERLVSERIALENRIENLLCLHGVTGFRPRLKKAMQRLAELCSFPGTPLPPMLVEELRRLMARHRLLSEQLREIEMAREQVAMAAEPDNAVQQIQMLTRLIGLGLATATGLTREVFYRSFADRRAIAAFVGLTGTVQQRWLGTRAGHQQERQPTGAPYPVAVGVALAALSARQRIELLVPRAHRGSQRTHPQDHGGGTRAQAAGGIVALCRDR